MPTPEQSARAARAIFRPLNEGRMTVYCDNMGVQSVNPCDQPHMSTSAWRRFVAAHPHWIAPHVAPCSAAGAALGLAIVIAPVPVQPPAVVTAPPVEVSPAPEWPGYGPGPYVVPQPAQPAQLVDVPEPGSLWIVLTGVGMTAGFSAARFRARRDHLRRIARIVGVARRA